MPCTRISFTSASVGSISLPVSREIRSTKNQGVVFPFTPVMRRTGFSSCWWVDADVRLAFLDRGTSPRLSHEIAESDPPFSFPRGGRRGGDGSPHAANNGRLPPQEGQPRFARPPCASPLMTKPFRTERRRPPFGTLGVPVAEQSMGLMFSTACGKAGKAELPENEPR